MMNTKKCIENTGNLSRVERLMQDHKEFLKRDEGEQFMKLRCLLHEVVEEFHKSQSTVSHLEGVIDEYVGILVSPPKGKITSHEIN